MILIIFLPFLLFAVTDAEFAKIQQAQRQVDAHTVKSQVAEFDESKPRQLQIGNGDEALYEDLRGSFNKGLRHLGTGFPDRQAFLSMVRALSSGIANDFNAIQVGLGAFRLVNPQASFAYSLPAIDGWINVIPPAPAFASAQTAGEMVEVYWTVQIRDVPFNAFSVDATVAMAVAGLNALSDFQGPKVGGVVTPGTFLRGNTAGDLVGPYISQFLYLDIPYGSTTIPPLQTVPLPGIANDFLSTFADWDQVENGGNPVGAIAYDAMQHFIRTPRDLAEYVHQDTPGQAARNALLILSFSPGFGVFDPANPYVGNLTQTGFVTFGIGDFFALVQNATQEALKAAWYQKWQVNRRLRPEEFGFYVQQQVANGIPLGIHPDLINATALPSIFATFGSYFLPTAFPEGCPLHPAYPAGHAAFIGAAVTILKALFDENHIIPAPIEPNGANTMLVAYAGTPLTVGGELNKLAANIALGRDHGGVHYRSDGYYGMLLGEQVAIDILNNQSFLFNENFNGFTLTKFDGTTITVGKKRNPL